MKSTHAIFDHLIFAFILLMPLAEWRWNWPRYLRRLAAGEPGVRLGHFRTLVVSEWVLVACVLAAWIRLGRPWPPLLLTVPTPWRLACGLAFVAAVVSVLVSQRFALLKRPQAVDSVRKALRDAEPLLPHTAPERRLFGLVSLTAGVCEEFLYRGFVTWYFAARTGLAPAVFLSAALFGFGHIYLGARQVPRTFLVGLIMSGVAVASGSLWPAMLLHAAIDWNSGELRFRILNEPGAPAPPAAA